MNEIAIQCLKAREINTTDQWQRDRSWYSHIRCYLFYTVRQSFGWL